LVSNLGRDPSKGGCIINVNILNKLVSTWIRTKDGIPQKGGYTINLNIVNELDSNWIRTKEGIPQKGGCIINLNILNELNPSWIRTKEGPEPKEKRVLLSLLIPDFLLPSARLSLNGPEHAASQRFPEILYLDKNLVLQVTHKSDRSGT
jgi:hypothetical protein